MAAQSLRSLLKQAGLNTTVLSKADEIVSLCVSSDVDIVVAGMVGAAGLNYVFSSAKAGKRILLANKESLVMAGTLLMQTTRDYGAQIMPVDSEHNAIFQSLPDHYVPGMPRPQGVESIILTASGGPFLDTPLKDFHAITPEQAVNHPRWSMGAKISIDSATMMNKVLEVIEAHFLFSMPIQDIDTVIHPQSVIHSMVRYLDGSVIAQMGEPDMRIPIMHALSWPHRSQSGAPKLDFLTCEKLVFKEMCVERFPCFDFARASIEKGQAAMIALNAANEVAVSAFLAKKIGFSSIYSVIDTVLQTANLVPISNLHDIMQFDHQIRRSSEDLIAHKFTDS